MHGCVFGGIFGRLNLPRGLMTSTYTSLIALNLSINCSLNNLLHRKTPWQNRSKKWACLSEFAHPFSSTSILWIWHSCWLFILWEGMREKMGLVMHRKYKARRRLVSSSLGFLGQCHRLSWHLGNSWLLRSSSRLFTAFREPCLPSDGAIRPATGMTVLPRGASGQQNAHSTNLTLSHNSSSRSVMRWDEMVVGQIELESLSDLSVVFQFYYRGDGWSRRIQS